MRSLFPQTERELVELASEAYEDVAQAVETLGPTELRACVVGALALAASMSGAPALELVAQATRRGESLAQLATRRRN